MSNAYYSPSTGFFYLREVVGDQRPADAVPLSDAKYQQLYAARAAGKDIVIQNGQPVAQDPPAPSLSVIKRRHLEQVNRDFEAAVYQLRSSYPESEVISWTKQETEALAWLANQSSPTPLIDALCAVRGVQKPELVSRIIAKAEAYTHAVGQMIGKRQQPDQGRWWLGLGVAEDGQGHSQRALDAYRNALLHGNLGEASTNWLEQRIGQLTP